MSREAREIAIQMGQQMLSPSQQRFAALPYVLTLFSATGMSESERLEVGLMMQKTIIEGFIRGVNVPGLMARRQQNEGLLNVGFNDSAIPTANSITFDRDSWRSKSGEFRANTFLNSFGSRMASTASRQPPPRMNAAVRQGYARENPRTGMLRTPSAYKAATNSQINFGTRAMGSVFDSLGQAARANGVAPTRPMDAVRHQVVDSPFTAQLKTAQENSVFETRNDLIRRGAEPMAMAAMTPRAGVASPRTVQKAGLGEAVNAAQAGGRPNKIVVYSGGGTWSGEVAEVKRNAEALGISVDVRSSLSGVDYNQYAAIIVPGGNSATEMSSIGGSEGARLAQAVQNGLNYMGHCAGSFLAGRLGIINGMPNYPTNNYYGGGGQVGVQNTFMFGGVAPRTMLFYGGPDLSGFGKTLAEHPSGSDTIVSNDYGQGHVILTAGHPSMDAPNDPDGPDDSIEQMLLKAIVAGTDPDGTTTPTGPTGPTGPNGTTDVNLRGPTIDIGNPAVNPSGPGSEGVGFGSKARRAQFRKTPVAGTLPENVTSPVFAQGLQNIMRQASPLLNGMAGSLAGRK